MFRVGLISDTHGLLRPEAQAFLRGCDHIVHGGDIGAPGILDELRGIAPVTAVRGNNDMEAWAGSVPETQILDAGGVRVYVIHDLAQLDADLAGLGVRVVVSGHSHEPAAAQRDGILYVNPGSAGRRRFKLPIAMGELTVTGAAIVVRIVELQNGAGAVRCLHRTMTPTLAI